MMQRRLRMYSYVMWSSYVTWQPYVLFLIIHDNGLLVLLHQQNTYLPKSHYLKVFYYAMCTFF